MNRASIRELLALAGPEIAARILSDVGAPWSRAALRVVLRQDHARQLLVSGVPRREAAARLMLRWGISKPTAYRAIRAALFEGKLCHGTGGL